MSDKEIVISKIRAAFAENEYPGDAYLQGSVEGCEPFEEVVPLWARATGEASSPIS